MSILDFKDSSLVMDFAECNLNSLEVDELKGYILNGDTISNQDLKVISKIFGYIKYLQNFKEMYKANSKFIVNCNIMEKGLLAIEQSLKDGEDNYEILKQIDLIKKNIYGSKKDML